MSTIAEFISGTVNESLKKLLQPVGLIPAAIFVLLNLASVYPEARDDGMPLAKAFADLDAPTQAAVVALLTLALGYFLLSASSTILDIVGGQLIRGSVLYTLLVWIQRRRRTSMLRDDAPNQWYSSKRFYLPTEGDPPEPLPSALGNVLVATQGTLERRYRLDMAALWSQLVASPELKELPARAVVEDERAARDTLVNTAFVLWLFAVEGLVFFTFRNEPKQALLALIAVPVGFVVYRFAVAKGHAWGSAVETLADLHRDKLHAALRLAKYGSLREERQVWERAGRFYVSASEDVSGNDVFEREDAPSVTAIPAGDLTIPDPVSAVVEEPPPASHPDWLRWIEYVVLVSKRRAAAPATNAEVLVDDPRVAWIEPFDAVEGSRGQPKVVRGSGNQRMLWSLDELAPGEAVSLQYELPLFTLQASAAPGKWGPVESELVRGVGFSVAVPDDVKRLRVERFASGDGRPELWTGQTRRRPTSSDGRTYEWDVTPEWDVAAGQSVWIVLPDQP